MPRSKKFQLGGSRLDKFGRLEYQIIPVVNGKPQLGGAFWDGAWKWIKGAANTVKKAVAPVASPLHDVIKKSGIVGQLASQLPGPAGMAAGMLAKQAGYGRKRKQAGGATAGRRIVKKGNAIRAAR